MNIKREIKRLIRFTYNNTIRKIKIWSFYRQKIINGYLFPTEKSIDIIVIAFNNVKILELQNRYIKKNLQDNYELIIADNSNDNVMRREIRSFCDREKISYISLPTNPYSVGPKDFSQSHGCALNWVFRNFVVTRKTNFVMFLDQDILPMRRINLADKTGNSGIYGYIRDGEDGKWYIWPGLFLISRSVIGDKRLDFRPIKGCDTGGGNYRVLFRTMKRNEMPKCLGILIDTENCEEYPLSEENASVYLEKGFSEIFDNVWYHLSNSSNWRGVQEIDYNKKLLNMEGYLNDNNEIQVAKS